MNNTDIILLGNNLSEGESLRALCPNCSGGSNSELTLSITRNEGLVWQCFRAKCNISGATNGATFSKGDKPKREYKQWEGKTHEMPDSVKDRILSMWGIHECPSWYWTTDFGGRVAMSIRSPEDVHRGWVLRSLHSCGTKALTYGEGPSWYINHEDERLWLVEDIPSAVRAAKYVNSLALLGTTISLETASELSLRSSGGITIALDQDATSIAFKLYHRFRGMWDRTQIQPLKQDLKNMNEEELKELLT